jgi:deoxyribose-phosphate aldolase
MSRPTTLQVSIDDLAQMIDHSLLHPTMTDDDVQAGLMISRKYGVATGSAHFPHHTPNISHLAD